MTLPSDSNPPNDFNNTSPQARPPVDPVVSPPPAPPGPGWGGYPPPEAPSKRLGWISRMVTGLVGSLLLASILLNIYLGIWFSSMMGGPSESIYTHGDKSQRIVILPIRGMIGQSTARFVHDGLAALRQDKPKAIVLRVDSGGGGVSSSDQVWHELVQFMEQTKIPVVASFGSVAASGGYYVAAPADFIIAEPTTITGSIGVIAEAFTLKGLLDKIGVQPELITATDATKKDLLNPLRLWTDEDRQSLRVILDSAYERFVSVVAQGRSGLSLDQTRQLATGEVYTSDQAKENKLVDEQGYLDAAIAKAKELAGISADQTPLVTRMSPPRGFGFFTGLSTHATADGPPRNPASVRQWIGELSSPRLEYRWVP